MKSQNGFTLIELLVVIAIIALLLSIIVPALKIAKERAMDTICTSNIKQYQVAMALYCSNNDENFANGEDWIYLGFINGGPFPTAPHSFNCVWHDATLTPNGTVVQYLGDNKVALCPLFAKIAPSRCNCVVYPSTHNAAIPIVPQFNYTLSAYLGAYKYRSGCKDQVVKITRVKSPSQVVMFGEENPMRIPASVRKDLPGGSNATVNDCLLWPYEPANAKSKIDGMGGKYARFDGSGFSDCFGTYHRAKDDARFLGFTNAVFVDGHVQYVAPEETLKFMWPY